MTHPEPVVVQDSGVPEVEQERRVLAWHNDLKLKARSIERMREHRAADSLIRGFYQKHDPAKALGYKGCALGCLLDRQPLDKAEGFLGFSEAPASGWAGQVEEEFGIARALADTIDDTFESLTSPDHAVFAVEVLEAIPVGADTGAFVDSFEEHDADRESPETFAERLIAALKALPGSATA